MKVLPSLARGFKRRPKRKCDVDSEVGPSEKGLDERARHVAQTNQSDLVCEAPEVSIDPNQQQTTSTYDVLCRHERTRRNLDAQDYVFEFFYNQAGLPSSTVYPDSDVISWTYDAAGGLETETGTITASTYDAAGRLTSRSFANGVVTTYTYSALRGWVENIHTEKSGTIHQDLDYSYYADGMIASVTSPKAKESWTYQYDDLNRLISAVNVDTPALSQSFAYDTTGNITWNSDIGNYTYPGAGQPLPHAVTDAGGRTYSYDAAGRMTSRNGTVIQWNGNGKPSSIGNIGFTYDRVGNRLRQSRAARRRDTSKATTRSQTTAR